MMICPNCKKENSDTSRYCQECGAMLTFEQPDAQQDGQSASQEQSGAQQDSQSASQEQQSGGWQSSQNASQEQSGGWQSSQSASQEQSGGWQGSQNTSQTQSGANLQYAKPKKLSGQVKGVIAGVAALFVVLIAVLIFLSTRCEKLVLADYIIAEYSGYDSKGTATITFDKEKFANDVKKYGKKLSRTPKISDLKSLFKYTYEKSHGELDEETFEEIEEVLDDISSSQLESLLKSTADADLNVGVDFDAEDKIGYYILAECYAYEVQNELVELKNGDQITVEFTANNELAKKYKLKFDTTEAKLVVSGLGEVTEVDPFEGVTVTFEGTAPNATATVDNSAVTGEWKDAVRYTIDPSYNIGKGETVTVTAEADEEELYAEYGCRLSSETKEYTCENVDSYLSDGAELKEDLLESMKGQAEDMVKANLAGKSNDYKYSNLKYAGYYFLVNKDQKESWDNKNRIYIVYSAKLKSKDKSFKETTVYLPVRFVDAMEYADGTGYVNLNNSYAPGYNQIGDSWYYVSGYTKEEDMKNELVTSQKGEFNEFVSDGLK